MALDRLNSPTTFEMPLEVLGHELQFTQDPNSKHLGTTVWDSSLVFAKFLERNCRKGRFSPAKLKGKRVIELGAGCGVSGFGMALLGCDVIVTDQKEVLPLLQRNVERNISRVMQKNPDLNGDNSLQANIFFLESFGSIKVAELQWGDESHIKAVDPPFDYIIGTDVVYVEHLLEPLLQTILALSGPRTTILLGHEIRSTCVHEKMLEMWKQNFDVKNVPKSKMDETYQHPSIQLFIMGFKNSAESTGNSGQAAAEKVDDQTGVEGKSGEENLAMEPSSSVEKIVEDHEKAATGTKKLSEWEARRYGSMAARILKDVKIS
ncbi:protein N-lysine methyltransferase METTL21A [Arachis ipaensis]|uniref:protein N-lysine methyltransferase METTL21A n=1 Tax=Arachis ipaensis TaxID=130454 RepID=UPI000A2B1AB7|nr:protein N-lysine methyltransferase METTL21A [Arachis ipaensis]XP_025641696.1 protein N-lysine methyltransferase METTL21A isoform X1 [Arachis hypogaea]XP_025641697.1 protein N-lysine methyltransferase METTL21A isoform X1 [Arachis hypogaea]